MRRDKDIVIEEEEEVVVVEEDEEKVDEEDEEEEEEERRISRIKEIRLAGERERQRVSKREQARRMAEASKEEMKEVSKVMDPLPRRIYDLLRLEHEPALSSRAQRGFVFMETELSTTAAALRQLALRELGPGHVDSHIMSRLWHLTELVRWIGDLIDGYAPEQTETELQELNLAWIEQLLLDADDADHTSMALVSHDVHEPRLPRLIGTEGATNKLVRWLMDNREKRLKVLSIVGSAGMGKTSLAMEVFRLIGGEFQCCAVVKVSRRLADTKRLLRHIMSQIIDSAVPMSSENSQTMKSTATLDGSEYVLDYDINGYLQHKRFLIVIDDIWKPSDWEDIRGAFPNNGLCSRIIVTTRVRSVAHLCCSHSWPDGHVHEAKPLSELDSERLFTAKAFGSEHSYPSDHLRQVSNEILRRCDGTPLFISVTAGLIKEEQGEVLDSSAAYWLGNTPELKQVEEALSPSYDDLPCELKLLSLYMSTFLPGHKIDKYLLIRKWKAEGLIAIWAPREFEDLAEEYFSELVQRDIIRPVTCKYDSEVNTCNYEVNHFMFEFLVSKSAQKNFLTTSYTLSSGATVDNIQIRRMFLHQPDLNLPTLMEKMYLPHTRSLRISGTVNRISLDMFIHLVVLDLESWENLTDEDLLQICSSGKLFLLKYLSVRNTRVSKLPAQIKELSSLETLCISHTQISNLPPEAYELRRLTTLDLRSTHVKQLSKQMFQLEKLRHLFVNGASPDKTLTDIPDAIFDLTSLETLTTIDLSKCSVIFVNRLHELRFLEVLAMTWSFHQCYDQKYQEALCLVIQTSACLKSLTIHCDYGCSMEFLDALPNAPQCLHNLRISARFLTVPKWIQGLNHLVFLQITVCKLLPDDIKLLGSLYRLECLVLGLDFLPKQAMVIESEGYSPHPQNKGEELKALSGVQEFQGFFRTSKETVQLHQESRETPVVTKGFRQLLRFSIDCHVPWLIFREGAMEELTVLELKLCTGSGSQESVPSGISNLLSLERVILRYDPWYINSRGIKATVDAIRRQVSEVNYTVKLVNNGVTEDVEAILDETAGPTKTTQGESKSEAQLP